LCEFPKRIVGELVDVN